MLIMICPYTLLYYCFIEFTRIAWQFDWHLPGVPIGDGGVLGLP